MTRRLSVFALIAVLIVIGVACGKKDAAPAAESAQTAVQAAESGVGTGVRGADNLGEKIGSSYVETLKQVVAVLKSKPTAADAKAMLADLKTWTIELMVGLGKEREAMSVKDRTVVDLVLSNKISGVPMDLFKEYQDGQAFYKGDSELFNLIADFNIITQYANFDLLKKQLPEEAKRLGIM